MKSSSIEGPVPFRIPFVCLSVTSSGDLVALHGQLPWYLAEDCQVLTDIGRRSLWSADVLTCATRRTRTRLGDRSFSVAGPCLWNSLPVTLRDRDISLVQYCLRDFWRHFCLSIGCELRRIVTVAFFAPCTNILTYLLTHWMWPKHLTLLWHAVAIQTVRRIRVPSRILHQTAALQSASTHATLLSVSWRYLFTTSASFGRRSFVCLFAIFFVNNMSEWVSKSIYTQRIKNKKCAAASPNKKCLKKSFELPEFNVRLSQCSGKTVPYFRTRHRKTPVSKPSVGSRDSEGIGVSRAKTAPSGVSDKLPRKECQHMWWYKIST